MLSFPSVFPALFVVLVNHSESRRAAQFFGAKLPQRLAKNLVRMQFEAQPGAGPGGL